MFSVLYAFLLYGLKIILWIFFWIFTLIKRVLYYQIILYMVRSQILPYSKLPFTKNSRILLLITHADDGCIYFGPTILSLLKIEKCELFVLCILDNSYNKHTREERIVKKYELLKSCNILGIKEENIMFVTREFESKIDYLNNSVSSCANCVLTYIEGIRADFIFTFDKEGINRHPNHTFLFRTMSYLCMRRIIPAKCRVFKLQTISSVRKYSLFADLLISEWKSKYIFVLSPTGRQKVIDALQVYKLQKKWYNRILFQLSRFSYINSLEEMPVFKPYTVKR